MFPISGFSNETLVFSAVKVYNDRMITAILLSGGASRRFGSPKALVKFDGETVIERLQKMLIMTQVDEIIVVLGAHVDEIKPYLLNHKKVKSVYNKDHNFGQTSSFQAGLRSISDGTEAVLLLPVDYPLVEPGTVDALVRHFRDHAPLILLPEFNGKKGHPPLFSMSLKDEFLGLDHESGLNTIARAHQSETTVFPVEDPGVVRSFNTREEFEALQQH